jgi:hypothetical protein
VISSWLGVAVSMLVKVLLRSGPARRPSARRTRAPARGEVRADAAEGVEAEGAASPRVQTPSARPRRSLPSHPPQGRSHVHPSRECGWFRETQQRGGAFQGDVVLCDISPIGRSAGRSNRSGASVRRSQDSVVGGLGNRLTGSRRWVRVNIIQYCTAVDS